MDSGINMLGFMLKVRYNISMSTTPIRIPVHLQHKRKICPQICGARSGRLLQRGNINLTHHNT
jgi:hypothetical protein